MKRGKRDGVVGDGAVGRETGAQGAGAQGFGRGSPRPLRGSARYNTPLLSQRCVVFYDLPIGGLVPV